MKKLLTLLSSVLLVTILHASPTPIGKSDTDASIRTFLSIKFDFNLFSCTVTRSARHSLVNQDCDGLPILIITTGSATATAATCEEANLNALMNAQYNAYMQAQHAYLLITGDCQGPPEP